MIKLVVLTGLASLTEAAVTPQEACWFVGFRFALTPSVVDGTVCKGLFIGGDGRIAPVEGGRRPLTSDEAVGVMREELDEMQGRGGTSAKDLQQNLKQYADRAFRTFTWGLDFDLGESVWRLQRTMGMMERLASGDWSTWIAEAARPWSPIGAAILYQYSYLTYILREYVSRPLWKESTRDLLAALMYYLYDVCALAGPQVCKPGDLTHARLLMHDMRPLYRHWRSREAVDLLAFPVKDWDKLEAAILRDPANARPLAGVFVQMYASSDNPRMVLLKQALVPFLCRDPLAFIQSLRELRESRDRYPIFKYAENLMCICTGHASREALDALHGFVNAPRAEARLLAVTWPDSVSIVSHLTQPSVDVYMGLAGELQTEEKGDKSLEMVRAVIREAQVLVPIVYRGERVTRLRLVSEDANSDDLRALGRAMGLALRYGKSLSELRLAREVALWLHPRIMGHVSWKTAYWVEETLGLTSAQRSHLVRSIHFVSSAMRPGLGLGGFALLSDSQWADLFGVADGRPS